MSAELSLVQQAGASAPAASVPVVRPRVGAELALALAASAAEDRAAGRGDESRVLDAEKLTVYHVALELQSLRDSEPRGGLRPGLASATSLSLRGRARLCDRMRGTR
jgi:hypothetical protein